MRRNDKLRTRKICPRCGELNNTDRSLCPRCILGYPKMSQFEFCAMRYAKGNKKLFDEVMHTPPIQFAEALAAYVKDEQFFGETTFVGIAIWEALSTGFDVFANKWTTPQFLEFLKSDVTMKRYGEYLAAKKNSEWRRRKIQEQKEAAKK